MNNKIESVFEYLLQTKHEPVLACRNHFGGNDLWGVLKQTIFNDIFPSIEEDARFLAGIWPMIAENYSLWYISCSHDGSLFKQLMNNQKTIEQFRREVKKKNFLGKLRKSLYRRAFHLEFVEKNLENSLSLLRTHYQKLNLTTMEIILDQPAEIIERCTNYYHQLGYTFLDGVAVNSDSIFVLTRDGEIPLTTATFNLGVLPDVLEASISLQTGEALEKCSFEEYGWTKEHLIAALAPIKEETALRQMSKPELVMHYRVEFGTDGYIDWDSVLQYQYLLLNNLKTVAYKTFGRARDVLEEMDYAEIVAELKLMSNKALSITENARQILENEKGSSSGRTYRGLAYVLRQSTEDLRHSFWYPDFSGNLHLMYAGKPIPNELIPVSYKTFQWACERQKDISVGYFIVIAQRLGLWPILSETMSNFHGPGLCQALTLLLEELLPKYLTHEKEDLADMHASTEEWLRSAEEEEEEW